MVEMENTKLDHDQEVLRLKGLLAQKAPTSKYFPSTLQSIFSFDYFRRQTLIDYFKYNSKQTSNSIDNKISMNVFLLLV